MLDSSSTLRQDRVGGLSAYIINVCVEAATASGSISGSTPDQFGKLISYDGSILGSSVHPRIALTRPSFDGVLEFAFLDSLGSPVSPAC